MYPKKIRAIRVKQPFGEFFICNITARDLIDLTFSDPLRFKDDQGNLKGNQRVIKEERTTEIGKYIQTVEAAFPNSIIISANYNQQGFLCEKEDERWHVIKDEKCGVYDLVIPTSEKLASIIDGQHRLNGFLKAPEAFRDFELLCSIYLDLPNPFQAYVFATINFNQKKVDKSLAYEQFGFNLDDEPSESWSPEKLAVFFTRKLNTDKESKSPFYNHIILAPQDDKLLFEHKAKETAWAVSTATMVDSIIRLISKNPKSDKYELHKLSIENRKRDTLKNDGSPFRKFYLQNNDLVLYKSIINYFSAANDVLFRNAGERSYIRKTIGIQALFEFLYIISVRTLDQTKDISYDFYSSFLYKASTVDFAHPFFQASALGKNRIKNVLLLINEFETFEHIKREEVSLYKEIIK